MGFWKNQQHIIGVINKKILRHICVVCMVALLWFTLSCPRVTLIARWLYYGGGC